MSFADVPPPGAGFVTVTGYEPGTAISVLAMVVRSWVLLTKVVACEAPLNEIVEPVTKLLPVTVNVKLPDPATADDGLSVLSVGAGLGVPQDVSSEASAAGRSSRCVVTGSP